MTDPAVQEQTRPQDLDAIGFCVCGEEYGLPLTVVQETITLPHITRVPRAPAYILGVINLHGNVIPVIDVAVRFGIGRTTPGQSSRIVVIQNRDETIGILAEHIGKLARLTAADLRPPPPLAGGIAAEYLDGVVRLPDRFLIFLNLDKTLAYESAHPASQPRDR